MKISDFLRWGAKNDTPTGAGSDAVKVANGRNGAHSAGAEAVEAGPATIDWISTSGSRHRERTSVEKASGRSSTAVSRMAIPAGAAVWVSPDGDVPRAAIVRSCDSAQAGGHRITLSFDCPINRQEGRGGVCLQWLDARGRLISTPATIRSARAEGMIEAITDHSLPMGVLALLVGKEHCCLGEVRACRSGEECNELEIEAVAEARTFGRAA